MPLQLDNNGNISTPTGDTGTYTWEDVLTLNSSKMTTLVENKIYQWSGTLTLKGTSKLTILNKTLFILNGFIETIESAVIDFGEELNAKNGCYLIISNNFAITYTRGNNNTRINLYGCCVEVIINNNRIDFLVSKLIDCNVKYTNTISLFGLPGVIFIQSGGIISNCIFKKIGVIELPGDNYTIDNIQFFESSSTFFNYENKSILPISNFKSIDVVVDYSTYEGGFRFINSNVNLSNGSITYGDKNQNAYRSFLSYTHYLKIVNNNIPVSNALIRYIGFSNITQITDNNGNSNLFLLDSQHTNFATGYTNIPIIDVSNYTRIIKSYLHIYKEEVLNIDRSLGTSAFPFVISLNIDIGITQSQTVAETITGIIHTPTTITVTNNLTLNQIYDSRKAYWRNTNNVAVPYLEGNTLHLNNANLVVDGINLVASSKFKNIKTTGTISYLNNGNTSFPTIDSNGIRFRIYGLPTTNNPIIRVKNLTTNVITYPTINNGEVYITLSENTNYEIRADARGYVASNFITIDTTTDTELELVLKEYKDNLNISIYGRGVLAEKNLIDYNLTTSTLIISYSNDTPTISLFSMFDKIEEILATNAGLEVTSYPIYDNNKLVFTRDILTNNQNNIKIKPNNSNTDNPEFIFELVRVGDEKPYNLFDFSTSNGRIIKYPTTTNIAQFSGAVTIDSQQIANTVWNNTARTLTSSSALTTEQANKLNNLDVAVSTRLPSTSYTQAPTTTQIRTELESSIVLAKEATTASRASQSSVNLIPVNTVLTTDTRLNNLDTTISSRLSASAYNKAPTVTDIRTELSTELSKLDVTVSSRATSTDVWTSSNRSLTEGVTVTTNNDKTNYELSINSINAIWNTLINSLTTIGSIGKRIVDYLDTTISSRSSQNSLDNKPNLTDIESSTIIAKQSTLLNIPTTPLLTNDIRLNTLDANISTRLPIVSYLAPLTSTETSAVINNVLNTKDLVTNTNLITTKTDLLNAITLTGLTTEQSSKLNEININVLKLKKLRGLVNGISVIAKAPTNTTVGYLKTSDNDISLTITKNGDEEILSG